MEVINETMAEIYGTVMFIALIFLGFGIFSYKKRKKILDWPETEGKVVEDLGSYIKEIYDSDTKHTEKRPIYECKVSYTANGEVIEYVKEMDYRRYYNVGDSIPIKYDPENPGTRHESYNSQSPWSKGIPQFIIAAVLVVCGIVFFCLAYTEL